MKMDDMILVSVDDHLIEPEDMFKRHMPARLLDRAPRVVRGESGVHHWQIETRKAPGLALNAVAGRPREEYGMEPVGYDQVRPGCYDIHERIADMNANGVLGSICFGSFPGFGGARFYAMDDKDLALATIRAYNDWHLYDWCNIYPGRFIPIIFAPLWEPSLAAAEIKRMAALGARAITFPDNPVLLGLPGVHSEKWNPVWEACENHGVVICIHIASSVTPAFFSDETPISAFIAAMPMRIADAAADWMFGTMWFRYPKLRVALSEGGIGWIPYLLERADFTFEHHGPWTNLDLKGMKPSDIFKKHFICCVIDDDFGLKNRYDVGIDMITFETDYPHSDGVWPHSPEKLWRSIKDLPQDEIDKITHLNAMREFRYDPISILGREKCTVGALRAKAKDVDTALKSRGGLKPERRTCGPVTAADITKILSHVS